MTCDLIHGCRHFFGRCGNVMRAVVDLLQIVEQIGRHGGRFIDVDGDFDNVLQLGARPFLATRDQTRDGPIQCVRAGRQFAEVFVESSFDTIQ